MSADHPTKVNELPDGEFYVILTPQSVTIPGDLRSRTNPGHGYPEHRVDAWSMRLFAEKDDWEREILRILNSKYQQDFKAARMIPATIKTTVSVDPGE